MFSHVFLAASDFKRSYAFYAPLMQALDIKQRFHVPENSWAGWQPPDGGRPLVIVGIPFNLETAVGRARVGCHGVRWQGATTTRAHCPRGEATRPACARAAQSMPLHTT